MTALTRTRRWLVAAALLASAMAASGCSGPCVQEGDRLVIVLHAGDDLNDVGSGPQHVRYRVWAVRNEALFKAATPAALTREDPEAAARRGVGDAVEPSRSWITPGAAEEFVHAVTLEEQYTHVGLVVLYPDPKTLLVPLDCEERAGYEMERPEHRITIQLGRSAPRLGIGKRGAKP